MIYLVFAGVGYTLSFTLVMTLRNKTGEGERSRRWKNVYLINTNDRLRDVFRNEHGTI